MDSFKELVYKNWFLIGIFVVLTLAAFLRFYNYDNRWGLAYDQAYGALVARYALDTFQLPLLGPFSSAGPFQTGGEWYWFIMLATIFNSNFVVTPWVVLSVTSIIFVLLMILVGKELVGKGFGLIVGLLSAVSTSQITQSFNLTNQSIISLISLLAIWSSIRYLRTKRVKYLFLLGLLTSFAATVHLQGVELVFLVFTTIIFAGFPGFKKVIVLISGFIIPAIPILIFDVKSNFTNTRNMIQYFLHGQYSVSLEVLGRRWITYVGSFWPQALAHIIGGDRVISWIIISGIGLTSVFTFLKKKITKEWLVLITSFLMMVFYLRYLRTPLFDSYLMFLHPFIFLLSACMIRFFIRKKLLIGIILLTTIVSGSLYRDVLDIRASSNYSAKEAERWINVLSEKFPNEKFSIYSYKYKWADKNLILSLYLYTKGKIDNNGRRVGVVVSSKPRQFDYTVLEGEELGFQLLDLQSSSSAELENAGWVNVNPETIYENTQNWYKNEN